MRRAVTALIASVFALATIVHSEDAERHALAEQLLLGMEVQKMSEKSFEMLKQMIPTQMKQMGVSDGVLPDKAKDVMQEAMDLAIKEMSWDKLKDDYISIYAETFTAEELKGLVQFYESPVGKKFIEKQPELMQRSMQVSQKQMMTLLPKIQDLVGKLALQESAQSDLGSGEKKHKPIQRLPLERTEFMEKGPNSEKLEGIKLSDDPKPDEVKKYIRDIVNASQGQRTFSTRDPQIALLTRVGRQNLPLLIESLNYVRSMDDFYVQHAILSLTDETSKSLILDSLPIQQNLVKAVIQHGWEEDAKDTLLMGLKNAGKYLPTEWVQAVANLNDPESYPLLRDYFINGPNSFWTYKVIEHLPIKDMTGAVSAAWGKNKSGDEYNRINMAMIAAKYGHLDALEALIDSLASGAHDQYRLSTEIRQSVLRHTNFRGSNVELEVWFKANRDQLKFDPKTAKFTASTEVAPSVEGDRTPPSQP